MGKNQNSPIEYEESANFQRESGEDILGWDSDGTAILGSVEPSPCRHCGGCSKETRGFKKAIFSVKGYYKVENSDTKILMTRSYEAKDRSEAHKKAVADGLAKALGNPHLAGSRPSVLGMDMLDWMNMPDFGKMPSFDFNEVLRGAMFGSSSKIYSSRVGVGII